MKKISSRWLWRIASLVLLAGLLSWQVYDWRDGASGNAAGGTLKRLDALFYDWRFDLFTPQRPPLQPLAIVDLDEATLQREGRWPWDRAKVAALIEALRGYGVSQIGFDVVFSEAVENPVQRIIDAGQLPPALAGELASQASAFDGDARLAASLDESVVLGFFLHADGANAGVLPPPLHEFAPAEAARSTLLAMPNFTANLPQLAGSGAAGGFVVTVADSDGIIRRVPLLMRHENGVYVSLALQLVRQALGIERIELHEFDDGRRRVITGLSLDGALSVPLDADGSLLVPYKGKGRSYPTISATGILRGDAPPEELAQLEDAIVLVGTSAIGLRDLRSMPLETGYPGVEVHANIVDALQQAALGEDTIYLQPDWAIGATLLTMLGLGLLLAFALPGRNPYAMLLICTAVIGALLGGNLALWQSAHLALPLAAPLLLVTVIAVFNIVGGYLLANRQRHNIQNLFGEYVPATHVARMMEQPERVQQAGEQRVMTVLFADVRNFTTISEKLAPNVLKDVLNRYLSAVTEVIFDHQGTIDKYVGDMVMAFWNAPLDDPEHASHAIEAALAMQKRLAALREEFAAEGLPQLHMGIGLNSGTMNVGDMGSRYRRAYTVLGDAVNLGSRVEGLTAFYKLPLLVSADTHAAAPGFVWRMIDQVRVKGRHGALAIYQPLASAKEASAADHERAAAFEAAVAAYQERRWPAARAAFAAIAERWPEDAALCSLYAGRLQGDPDDLPPDWQAVHDHLQK